MCQAPGAQWRLPGRVWACFDCSRCARCSPLVRYGDLTRTRLSFKCALCLRCVRDRRLSYSLERYTLAPSSEYHARAVLLKVAPRVPGSRVRMRTVVQGELERYEDTASAEPWAVQRSQRMTWRDVAKMGFLPPSAVPEGRIRHTASFTTCHMDLTIIRDDQQALWVLEMVGPFTRHDRCLCKMTSDDYRYCPNP